MLAIFTIVAFGAWFALIYPLLRRALEQRRVAPPDVRPFLPFLLMAAAAFVSIVYVVDRGDGTALLDQGLSASNRVTIAITALTGLYVLWQIARDKRVLRLPFAMPYLPFTMMILFDVLSTAWSVVPSYTIYRAVELAILFIATILLFDRKSIVRSLPVLIGAFIVTWLVLAAPTYADNIAHGIIFSSAKHNVTPMLCFVLFAYGLFVEPNGRMRLWQIGLSLAGLVIAGSAASTAAMIGLIPAVLVASPRRIVRVAGVVFGLLCVAGFLLLTINLSDFPGLLHAVSTVLQKPEEQLANATGREVFWPALIAATRDHFFGSGFAAADRFLQLLLPPGQLRVLVGDTSLNLSTAHNMYISAWAGTGLAGIALGLTVLGTAVAWALKLAPAGRRFVLSFVFFLALNGMTTPAIFSSWNIALLAFVAVLAYARVAVGQQAARGARAGALPAFRLQEMAAAPSRAPS